MSADAIVSLPSPGAGRRIDVYGHDGGGGTWGTTSGRTRGGAELQNANVQIWKATLAALTGEYYKGRSALGVMHPNQADYSRYTGFAHNCLCVKPLETVPDDNAVASIRAHLAYAAFGGAHNADEYGVTLVPHALDAGVGYTLVNAGNVGSRIVFGPVNDNTARIIARNGAAGVTVNVNYALAVNVSEWKQWELRSVSATASADAYVVGFINGKQVTDKITIGALNQVGTAPPTDDGSGSERGYRGGWVWVGNSPGTNVKMYYGGMNWIMAPNEAALA